MAKKYKDVNWKALPNDVKWALREFGVVMEPGMASNLRKSTPETRARYKKEVRAIQARVKRDPEGRA